MAFAQKAFKVDVRGMAAEVGRRVLIRVAKETLAREQRERGFTLEPRVIVDGMYNRPVETVKPFGVIHFVDLLPVRQAALFIWSILVNNSPVGKKTDRRPGHPGLYKSSHIILIDGEIQNEESLRTMRPGARVLIANTTPYARKLDRRYLVYDSAYRLAVKRFGRAMFIDFKMIPLPQLGARVMGAAGGGAGRSKVSRQQVYPAIQFYRKA